MTQDERWQARYDEVVGFIQANHRNPSKYYQEDRQLYTWMKHQRKVMNAGGLKPERAGGRGQVPDTGADTGNQILCMNPRPIPVSLSN